jgi:hypothetical protein
MSWSSHAIEAKPLAAIIQKFLLNGPVVTGIDDAIERR